MSAGLPINAVSKRTGLSQHVIRVWEKRYRAVEPGRSRSGRRLYSEADVRRLGLLHRLTRQGHSIGQVASLPQENLEALVQASNGSESHLAGAGREERIVAESVSAIRDMDRSRLEECLRSAAIGFGTHGALENVIAPLTERIGEMWRVGKLTAAHEHFASVVIREYLWAATRPFAPTQNAPTLVVTTPIGQLHELGAVIVATAAADLGWHVIYLGPSLPPGEIAAAVMFNKASAVALSIVYPLDDERLPKELDVLRQHLPPGAKIIAGGRGAPAYQQALDRVGAIQPGTLQQLYDELNNLRRVKTVVEI